MKKRIVLLLAVCIILSGYCACAQEDTTTEPAKEISEAEAAQKLAEFEKLAENERLQLWRGLPSKVQANYLRKYGVLGLNAPLAHQFFDNTENVNTNIGLFQSYVESLKVRLIIGAQSQVISYNNNGLLRAANGQINILQFKDKYSFKIDENNNLILIDADGKEHAFKGDLEHDSNGKIKSTEATIDNVPITGEGISFSTNEFGATSIHAEKATKFNGIEVAEPQSFIYDITTKGTFVKDAKITAIPEGTLLYGQNVELPSGNVLVRGNVVVHSESHIELQQGAILDTANKERITAIGGTVHAHVNNPSFAPEEHQNENYVFSLAGTKFDVHTVEGGIVKADILPGNELFNTFKKEYVKDEGFIYKQPTIEQSREYYSTLKSIDEKIKKGKELTLEEQAILSIRKQGLYSLFKADDDPMIIAFKQEKEAKLALLTAKKAELENQLIDGYKVRASQMQEWRDKVVERNRERDDAVWELLSKEIAENIDRTNKYLDKLNEKGNELNKLTKEIDDVANTRLPDG